MSFFLKIGFDGNEKPGGQQQLIYHGSRIRAEKREVKKNL
jgi:hypothetical protein